MLPETKGSPPMSLPIIASTKPTVLELDANEVLK